MHYSSKTRSWALVTVSSDSLNYNWKGNALWQQFYCKALKALIIKHLLAIFNHLKAINCVFNQSTCILEEHLHLWMFVCYPWWSWTAETNRIWSPPLTPARNDKQTQQFSWKDPDSRRNRDVTSHWSCFSRSIPENLFCRLQKSPALAIVSRVLRTHLGWSFIISTACSALPFL